MSLLIGTNDLGGMGRSRAIDQIASQTDELVRAIRRAAPEALLVVNSVMPRTRPMAPTISALNEHYARTAASTDSVYLDLWPALAAPDGSLRDELTEDRLHLNGAGYEAWVSVLRTVFDTHIPLSPPDTDREPDQ